MREWVGQVRYRLTKKLFLWAFYQLRKAKKEDLRAVKDNPSGTITFQGVIWY